MSASNQDQSRRAGIIDRYRYPGYRGCHSWCALEILPLADGRTVVICTEPKDNPGTSITNMCEHLAFWVCRDFRIDPLRLVWIEHYGYPSAFEVGNPRPFDLVDFDLMPAGRDGIFSNPRWRRMADADWAKLGLPPRKAVTTGQAHESQERPSMVALFSNDDVEQRWQSTAGAGGERF